MSLCTRFRRSLADVFCTPHGFELRLRSRRSSVFQIELLNQNADLVTTRLVVLLLSRYMSRTTVQTPADRSRDLALRSRLLSEVATWQRLFVATLPGPRCLLHRKQLASIVDLLSLGSTENEHSEVPSNLGVLDGRVRGRLHCNYRTYHLRTYSA